MNSALLYVRVSSKEQEKEGYSLDAQEKLGLEYALRNNLKIVKRWKVSESAWKEERTAFSEMLEYAKRHDEVKHIIFDVTDRMTRNDMDKIRIYTLIKFHDKTIHFSRSNKTIDKNSGSEDVFMLDIEVAVAKKMSNDISRKTKMGMLEKAEQGLYPSVAPLGYKNNPVTHLIEVDEGKAPYLQKVFSLMASGSYSINMVCNILYEEGFRTHKNKRLPKSSLGHLLRNPVYYGAFSWSGKLYQGSHTPLVSKEMFDKVQNVLSGNFHPNISKRNFSFNNLIICGLCGCKITGERKKEKYNYYHCTFSKGRHNGLEYIREEKLANMFEEPIRKVTLKDDIAGWLTEGLRERSKSALQLQENRFNSLKTQYDKINARLNRLYDMRIDGEINEDIFKSKEEEYKSQLVGIKLQMDNTPAINPSFYETGCKTLELSKRLYSQYVRVDYEKKAKILRFVASNYTLNDLTLYPAYRKPFDTIAKGLSRPNWLPEGVCCENLYSVFYLELNSLSRRRLRESNRYPEAPPRAYVNPIKLALKYQTLLKEYDSYSELAKSLKVSRVRVFQVLNLLNLNDKIKNYLLSVEEPKLGFLTERRLRPLTNIKNPDEQVKLFNDMVKNLL